MKFIKSFIQIDSYIKDVKFTKFNGNEWGSIDIKFYNNRKIKIEPKAEDPSLSYIVEFNDYNFSKLINNKPCSLVEITYLSAIQRYFKDVKPFNFTYALSERYPEQNFENIVNKFHLYRLKFVNNYSFYFGLINSSDGNQDGNLQIKEK